MLPERVRTRPLGGLELADGQIAPVRPLRTDSAVTLLFRLGAPTQQLRDVKKPLKKAANKSTEKATKPARKAVKKVAKKAKEAAVRRKRWLAAVSYYQRAGHETDGGDGQDVVAG